MKYSPEYKHDSYGYDLAYDLPAGSRPIREIRLDLERASRLTALSADRYHYFTRVLEAFDAGDKAAFEMASLTYEEIQAHLQDEINFGSMVENYRDELRSHPEYKPLELGRVLVLRYVKVADVLGNRTGFVGEFTAVNKFGQHNAGLF